MGYEDKTKEELIKELEKRDLLVSENYLRSNEAILEAILESTADGIVVLDYKGMVLHSNRRFKELWSIPEEVLESKDGWNIANYVKAMLLEPEDFIEKAKKIITDTIEYRDIIQFKSGKILERYFKPLVLYNKSIGTVLSFKDITQRVALENELFRNHKLYIQLIELLPDGVLVYKDGSIFLVNNAAARMLKQSKDNILGSRGGTVAKLHPDCRQEALGRMQKLILKETSLDFMRQKLILEDGSVIDVDAAGFSFKNEEHFFVTTIFRDITDHIKVEQLEKTVYEKNQLLKEAQKYNNLKTQLFSTISHELKTPLNIIFGSVQLLEKLYESSTPEKYLKIMKQNCYRLLRLINNLIDINKIEIGFYKLELQNANIVRIIEDITLSVVEYTRSKGIELIFDTDIEEKLMSCDAEKLERVILNLLSNSIKFTEPGGTIEVNIFDKGQSIFISVKDSGIGIPEEMLDKIFETFRQVDSSLRRKAEGSGLGLSLVKSLVEMHGGKVSAKSQLGIGSEFVIELPVILVGDLDNSSQEIAAAIDSKVEKVQIEFSDIYSY